jgi:hypothetical protein
VVGSRWTIWGYHPDLRDFTLMRVFSRSYFGLRRKFAYKIPAEHREARVDSTILVLLDVTRRRWLFFFRMRQAKLFHFVTQSIATDVQQLGGFDLIAMGLLQGKFNQRVFHIL